MSVTTIRDGEATLKMSADFRAIIDRIADGAQAATVEQVYAVVSMVKADAKREWYRQVDRETGKSGDVRASWEESGDRLHFKIGNSDKRTDKRTGKPILFYVHRPGPLSEVSRKSTEAERIEMVQRGERASRYIKVPNPKASDGRYLLAELITKPMNDAKRKIAARLGRRVTEAIRNRARAPKGGS